MAAAIAGIGRTEDVRFSPDNRTLAIAGFKQRAILLLRVAVERSGDGPAVAATDFLRLTSSGIGEVHGIDFIDDRTIAVANRDADVTVLALPAGELGGRDCDVRPQLRISGDENCQLTTPGSVAARREWWGRVSLLVCNNYAHKVTRHVVRGHKAAMHEVLMEGGLDIPDGIALSRDRRWAAVSSHYSNDVKLYRFPLFLKGRLDPVGSLAGANFPHGLRFTRDGRHMVVADAGNPLVHVYGGGPDWTGTRRPLRSVVVVDEMAFARGHHNPEEGGPKGIDIDRTDRVVAVTCEEQPLAFFDLRSFLQGSDARTAAAAA